MRFALNPSPMRILVTGAAGFIGANLVKALNDRGETDLLVVDNLTRAQKFGTVSISTDSSVGFTFSN